jgi:hypothetical protein
MTSPANPAEHRVELGRQIKFVLHLRRDPKHADPIFFLLGRFSRADHDVPAGVSFVDEHCHPSRPRAKLNRALLDQSDQLFRRSSGPSHDMRPEFAKTCPSITRARYRLANSGASLASSPPDERDRGSLQRPLMAADKPIAPDRLPFLDLASGHADLPNRCLLSGGAKSTVAGRTIPRIPFGPIALIASSYCWK